MTGPQPPTLHPSRLHRSDDRGVVVGCDTCGAVLDVDASDRGIICPYCATATVVERAPLPDRPHPSFTIRFTVSRDDARARARAHLRRRWLAPERVRRAAVDVRAVYVPAYLWSASAHSEYTARIGEDYEVSERDEVVDANGRRRTRTTTHTETAWHALTGRHACWLRDLLVTASAGIPNPELEAIQPFDLRTMTRHHPQLVAGWPSEEPSLSRTDCDQLASTAAKANARQRVIGHLPGDHWRDLRVTTRLDEVSLDLVLLPVWIATIDVASTRTPVRVLVNGQSGAVGERVPTSLWKAAALMLFVIVALASIAWGLRP